MLLHEVLTTEKVPFTYRVAGVGSRFLAWTVDGALLVVLGFVGVMLGNVLERGRQGTGMAVIMLWIFALRWTYFLLFEWLWQGQTPGKRLLGIRVIQVRGSSISFYPAVVRNLLRVVDGLPFFYALGFAVAACDRTQRRLGDLAAGTLVVQVERKSRPLQTLSEGSAAGLRLSMVRQRLAQLGRPQKQTLIDLCLRRDQLSVQDRARLFHVVAEFFQERHGLLAEEFQSDEKFVCQLVTVLGSEDSLKQAALSGAGVERQ
jgi:uncharacterized RDD family membrane protein YckC